MRKYLSVFALLIIVIFITGCKDQNPPTIEKGEFPFIIIYEVNGEKYTIEDTVICEYSGLDNSSLLPHKPRTWNAYLKSGDEEKAILLRAKNVESILKKKRIDEEIVVVLDYGMGDYYMGDPNAESLIHGKPHICYSEKYSSSPNIMNYEATELSEKKLEKYFGIEIIEFSFREPIKNTFK